MNELDVLRGHVRDLEIALERQRKRADRAQAQLGALNDQNPIAWVDHIEYRDDPWSFSAFKCRTNNYPNMPIYARPIPATHPSHTHCDNCGLTWLDDGLNPIGCPYCKESEK